MANLNRRHFIAAAGAAAAALPMAGKAFAQEKVKIGFVFLGPIGDYGWTWAHNKGREAVNAALGDKVETIYTENVAEDASAVGAIRDLCNAGCKLIFTTSYGYMDQTIEVAKEFPDVKFEHCTGFKRADNVSTYNSKFHEGRAVLGGAVEVCVGRPPGRVGKRFGGGSEDVAAGLFEGRGRRHCGRSILTSGHGVALRRATHLTM